MNETDWGRRQTGPARQQVVQAAAGPRRRYGVIDEVDDRRRSSVVGTAAAARRQGLRTETESTCTRADRISHNTLVTARLQLTFQITQATLHKRKYTRIWIYWLCESCSSNPLFSLANIMTQWPRGIIHDHVRMLGSTQLNQYLPLNTDSYCQSILQLGFNCHCPVTVNGHSRTPPTHMQGYTVTVHLLV